MASTPLTEGPVGGTLVRLAAPMVLGILAIVAFNVVDTFWVGQLGERELAAMSFTFPVTMVVFSLTIGLGIGATAVISRALGGGDRGAVVRLTTDAMALALVAVVVFAAVGVLSHDAVFSALGASPDMVPLIREYMIPWFAGIGLLVVPMVGNSAIRATGDTKTPSLVMMAAGGVNLVLDPFLIFGWGPFPALGLQGAALATVASYTVALAVAWRVLWFRERMVSLEWGGWGPTLSSWKRILRIGLPAAGTNLLGPVASAVITRLVAGHGEAAVAALGVSVRLESFAMVGVNALSTAITPFVGQNFGAGLCDRIRGAVRFSVVASGVMGGAFAVLLWLLGPSLASTFNDSADVIGIAALYLVVVPWSYAFQSMAQLIGSALNALDRPLAAASIVSVRLLVLAMPLAIVGDALFGLEGLFGGVALANLLVGLFAHALAARMIDRAEARLPSGPTPQPAPAPAS